MLSRATREKTLRESQQGAILRAKFWILPLLLASAAATGAHAVDLSEFKAVIAREDGGPHNDAFKHEFEVLHSRFEPTKDPSIIDRREFLGAQRLIVGRSKDILVGGTLHSTNGLELPAAMFSTFGRELAKTFKARLGLEDEAADLMAGVLEKQAVEMEGVSYAHYAKVTGRTLNLDREATAGILRGALEFLYQTSKVGTLCDVPFIAGYAKGDEHIIYIDRFVPERKIFRNVDVPVHKLLNVHERVEKVILDEYKATYPHGHQIALRLEKLFAEAIGVPWHAYDEYWGPLAEAVNARHFTQVPDDLDMIPYLSFTDAASVVTVEEMRASYVGHQACFRDQWDARSVVP